MGPLDHVTAEHLLAIWQVRKAGYEEGIMKYPAPFYDAVCALVDGLAQLPADEGIRFDDRDGDALFIVARTGAEIGRLPESLVRETDGPSP